MNSSRKSYAMKTTQNNYKHVVIAHKILMIYLNASPYFINNVFTRFVQVQNATCKMLSMGTKNGITNWIINVPFSYSTC